MTNSRLTDPEILEDRFPVRLRAVRHPPRQWRGGSLAGGDGVVRRLRFLAPDDRRHPLGLPGRVAPFGLAGGGAGAWAETGSGRAMALRGFCPAVPRWRWSPGIVLEIETPGGGGYGPPAASPSSGSAP